MDYIWAPEISFAITPTDIDTNKHFWNSFGKSETEVSARWIVMFCQARGEGWAPIPMKALSNFYHGNLNKVEEFWFNGLAGKSQDYYLLLRDETIYISKQFIARCRASSPA